MISVLNTTTVFATALPLAEKLVRHAATARQVGLDVPSVPMEEYLVVFFQYLTLDLDIPFELKTEVLIPWRVFYRLRNPNRGSGDVL